MRKLLFLLSAFFFLAGCRGTDAPCDPLDEEDTLDIHNYRKVRQGSGGLRLMEVTFNQADPSKWIETTDAIRLVSDKFAGKLQLNIIGNPGSVRSITLVGCFQRTQNGTGNLILFIENHATITLDDTLNHKY